MGQRIILLTGASSGIGEAVARLLVQQGDFPLLVSRRKDRLIALQRELGGADAFPCDVTSDAQVHQLMKNVIARYGRVDVLINNAGYGRFGGALDISMADFTGMAETNYLGAVRLTQAVLPYMLQREKGTIINVASVAGLTGIPNLSAYSASKFALIGFSEALKMEYAPPIEVGVLCPGPVQSPFFRGVDASRLFPPLIVGHMLDVETTARHVLQLIDRPTLSIVPSGMRWAMRLRRLAPGIYFRIMKRLYDSFEEKQHAYTDMKCNGRAGMGRHNG
ncbi:MAG: SDR family NAD(P)-dependent oxidoreductase [Novibacillus thermophilus]